MGWWARAGHWLRQAAAGKRAARSPQPDAADLGTAFGLEASLLDVKPSEFDSAESGSSDRPFCNSLARSRR